MNHRPCSRPRVHGGLLAALLLVAPAASAAPPADDDATSQRVAELYKRANALYDQKKLAEAEALYLEAWRLKKTYDVASNLGAIELDTGKPREAAEHFTFALREFPAGGKAAAREQLKARLALARAQVGAVRVRVNVAGALVTVGDRAVGKAPVEDEVLVTPGTVTVSASAPGYEQAAQSVAVAKGGSAEVSLTLREPRRSLVPLIVLASASAASLGVGVATTVVSNGKSKDANTQRAAILQGGGQCVVPPASFTAACGTLKSTLKSLDTTANVARGAYVAAGVLAVGAVTYVLLPVPKPAKSGGIRVTPVVGLNGGGAAVVGSW